MVVSSKRTFSEFVASNNNANTHTGDSSRATLVSKNLIPRGVSFKLLKTSSCSATTPKGVNCTDLYNSVQDRSEGISLLVDAATSHPELPSTSSDELFDAAVSDSGEDFAGPSFSSGYCYGSASSTLSLGQCRGGILLSAATDSAVNPCVGTDSVVVAAAATTRATSTAIHVSTGSRSASFSSSRRYAVPKADLVARERCFDYVVQAIDEVWARYCDTTTSAEEMVYGDLGSSTVRFNQHIKSGSFHGFRSSSFSVVHDNSEGTEQRSEQPVEKTTCSLGHKHSSSVDNPTDEAALRYDETGYKSEAASPAEYETDSGECRTVSNLPDSVKLQSLKCRLVKAKEDLEQHYDSREYSHSASFWKRWDMIKYSVVEVMEDDDDDDVVEATLDELEQGRCCYSE